MCRRCALVGHRPLLLVGAGVLIVDEQNRLLLQRRTDDGLWGIVGGGVEPGEAVEDAARREAREETGLLVGKIELFGSSPAPIFGTPILTATKPPSSRWCIKATTSLATFTLATKAANCAMLHPANGKPCPSAAQTAAL